jgi:hypothetical protein
VPWGVVRIALEMCGSTGRSSGGEVASLISLVLEGSRRIVAREGVGVRVGTSVVVALGVFLRLGVAGISGTLKSGALRAFNGSFDFVGAAFNVAVDFGFLMPLVLSPVGSAARFLVVAFAPIELLVSEDRSVILEERRRDILRTSF